MCRAVARLNARLHPSLVFALEPDLVTMVVELADGGRREVRCPLSLPRGRRRRLHALAHCFAECAMAIGLGTGVYRFP
jgi:hypothetical protein